MPDVPTLRWAVLDRRGPQHRLLVLLHGYGEPAEQLTDRLGLLDPDGTYVAVVPDAPFEHKGNAIWHRALTAPEEAATQYLASLAAIDALLGGLERDLGLPASEAVVGGFSQGGGMALGLLLSADVTHRPAGAFGVCSFAPVVPGLRVDRRAAAGRPFFLSSARADRFASIEASRSGAALLRDTGLALTYVESDGPHEMTDEAASAIGRWLRALDRGERPRDAALLAGVSGRGSFYDDLWHLVT